MIAIGSVRRPSSVGAVRSSSADGLARDADAYTIGFGSTGATTATRFVEFDNALLTFAGAFLTFTEG